MKRRESFRRGGVRQCRCFSTGRAKLGVVVAAVSWGIALAGWACETPVYRYAMYRWPPTDYEAFYFHRGPVSETDQTVQAALVERDKEGVAPNLSITSVDLERKDALEVLPDSVRKIWQDLGDKTLPRYVVVTPWGDPLFTGPIDQAAARQIIESPLRTEIGQRFHEGYGVVLLLLEGDQAEDNARMESVARRVMSLAASGRLFVDSAEDSDQSPAKDDAGSSIPRGDASPTDGSGGVRGAMRLALLKLNRSNTAETWLLKCLAAMTPDAHDLKPPYEPMLFAIYGRGRVMPPGIGKEVTVESLCGLLRFLGDRCSCTIKDQNPGLDLLMRWDWEAAAERFAAEEEASSGPPLYAEMAADGGGPLSLKSDVAGGGPSEVAAVVPPSAPGRDGPAASEPARTQEAAPTAGVAPPESDLPTQARSPQRFSSRQRWQLGLGLAGMALVVLSVGYIVVRRQHHASS